MRGDGSSLGLMKTNRSARRICRSKVSAVGLALAVLAVMEIGLGEWIAARSSRVSPVQVETETIPTPNVGLGELLAAVS